MRVESLDYSAISQVSNGGGHHNNQNVTLVGNGLNNFVNESAISQVEAPSIINI